MVPKQTETLCNKVLRSPQTLYHDIKRSVKWKRECNVGEQYTSSGPFCPALFGHRQNRASVSS